MKHIFLLGGPIAHSLSPVMHNAALRTLSLEGWRYELLQIPSDALPTAVARLRQEDCIGANVTIPHKEAVVEWLDELGASARNIGAVNTVVKRDGKLMGENTDGYGALQTLCESGFHPHGARVVILGAGGAARAVAFALAEAGALRLTIMNRNPARAEALAESLSQQFPGLALVALPHLTAALGAADLVVNATAVGTAPNVNDSPLPAGCTVPRGAVAFDLVYRPAQTRFLRDAAAAGARTVGGLGMLVHQGAAALRLWTGQAPVAVMFDAARQAMANEASNGCAI
jgi:shikimate dehydrogenase